MPPRLLMRGYPLLLCERREEARQPLVGEEAQVAATPAPCAAQAASVFSSLPNDDAMAEVALGEGRILARPRPGLALIETSTVSPAAAGRRQPQDKLDPAQFEPLSSMALLATGCPARSVRPGPQAVK